MAGRVKVPVKFCFSDYDVAMSKIPARPTHVDHWSTFPNPKIPIISKWALIIRCILANVLARIEAGELVTHNLVFHHCTAALNGSQEQLLKVGFVILQIWGRIVLSQEQRTILTEALSKLA
jgi:hypothetical protein